LQSANELWLNQFFLKIGIARLPWRRRRCLLATARNHAQARAKLLTVVDVDYRLVQFYLGTAQHQYAITPRLGAVQYRR